MGKTKLRAPIDTTEVSVHWLMGWSKTYRLITLAEDQKELSVFKSLQ